MESSNLLLLTLVVFLAWPLRRALFSTEGAPLYLKNDGASVRISVFDFLKGVAIVAVVLIHSIWIMSWPEREVYTLPALFLNALLRFAVPVFFIASGALVYLNDYSLSEVKKFYTKKFWRIFLPYLIVVFGYFLVEAESFANFLKNLITGDASPPLYFIVVLLQFYIVYPFLKLFVNKKWFLSVSFLFSLFCFFYIDLWSIGDIPFFGQFLFFFAYGMVWGKKFYPQFFLENVKKYKEFVIWLILVFLFSILFFAFPDYYYNTQLIYGIAIFNLSGLLFYVLSKENFFRKTLISFGKLSLWIFLLHFPITLFIVEKTNTLSFEYWLKLSIAGVISIFFSFAFALLAQKIYKNTLLRFFNK